MSFTLDNMIGDRGVEYLYVAAKDRFEVQEESFPNLNLDCYVRIV